MADWDSPNIVDSAIGFDGWISNLQIDLIHSTITFHVLLPAFETNEDRPCTVIFSGVSAFYFVRGEGLERFEEPFHQELDDGSWAVSEWTSAGYYPNGVGVMNVEAEPGSLASQWVSRHPATPNFAIELLAGIMFIEASRVQVNDLLLGDRVFDVGYPSV